LHKNVTCQHEVYVIDYYVTPQRTTTYSMPRQIIR